MNRRSFLKNLALTVAGLTVGAKAISIGSSPFIHSLGIPNPLPSPPVNFNPMLVKFINDYMRKRVPDVMGDHCGHYGDLRGFQNYQVIARYPTPDRVGGSYDLQVV